MSGDDGIQRVAGGQRLLPQDYSIGLKAGLARGRDGFDLDFSDGVSAGQALKWCRRNIVDGKENMVCNDGIGYYMMERNQPPVLKQDYDIDDWAVLNEPLDKDLIALIRFARGDRENELFRRGQRVGSRNSYYVAKDKEALTYIIDLLTEVENGLKTDGIGSHEAERFNKIVVAFGVARTGVKPGFFEGVSESTPTGTGFWLPPAGAAVVSGAAGYLIGKWWTSRGGGPKAGGGAGGGDGSSSVDRNDGGRSSNSPAMRSMQPQPVDDRPLEKTFIDEAVVIALGAAAGLAIYYGAASGAAAAGRAAKAGAEALVPAAEFAAGVVTTAIAFYSDLWQGI